jgi:hypothetical protein
MSSSSDYNLLSQVQNEATFAMHQIHPHHHFKRTTTLTTTHSITITPTPTHHAFTFPPKHTHSNNDKECTCSHSISTRTLIRYIDRAKTSTTLVTRPSSTTPIVATRTERGPDTDKVAAGQPSGIQFHNHGKEKGEIEEESEYRDGVIRVMGVVPGTHHPLPSSHPTSTSTTPLSIHLHHAHEITALTSTPTLPSKLNSTPTSTPAYRSTYPLISPPTFLYPHPPMIPRGIDHAMTPCIRSLSCHHPYQISLPSSSVLSNVEVYILLLSLVMGWLGSLVLCRKLTSFWAGGGCGSSRENRDGDGNGNGRSRKPIDKPSKYPRHFEDAPFSTSAVGLSNRYSTLPLHATPTNLNTKFCGKKRD